MNSNNSTSNPANQINPLEAYVASLTEIADLFQLPAATPPPPISQLRHLLDQRIDQLEAQFQQRDPASPKLETHRAAYQQARTRLWTKILQLNEAHRAAIGLNLPTDFPLPSAPPQKNEPSQNQPAPVPTPCSAHADPVQKPSQNRAQTVPQPSQSTPIPSEPTTSDHLAKNIPNPAAPTSAEAWRSGFSQSQPPPTPQTPEPPKPAPSTKPAPTEARSSGFSQPQPPPTPQTPELPKSAPTTKPAPNQSPAPSPAAPPQPKLLRMDQLPPESNALVIRCIEEMSSDAVVAAELEKLPPQGLAHKFTRQSIARFRKSHYVALAEKRERLANRVCNQALEDADTVEDYRQASIICFNARLFAAAIDPRCPLDKIPSLTRALHQLQATQIAHRKLEHAEKNESQEMKPISNP